MDATRMGTCFGSGEIWGKNGGDRRCNVCPIDIQEPYLLRFGV